MVGFGGVIRHSQPFLFGLRNGRALNFSVPSSYVGFATSPESKLGLNKPKKPLPAFMKFLSQVRPTLVSKNPGVNVTGIVKLASKHWEQLNQDAKSKMIEEYEGEMTEYKKKKEAFMKSLTEEQKENISKLKEEMLETKERRRMKAELKDLGRPKRPLTSYLLFSQSNKDKTKGKSFTESAAILSEKWKNVPPLEKAVYEKKSKGMLEAYQKDLAQWEQKMIRMGNIDHVRNKALMPGNTKTKKSHSE